MSTTIDEIEVPARNGRLDLQLVSRLIKPRSTVLDLGCGDGELMDILVAERDATVRGVEISEEGVYHCIARGLSVHHGDLDEGLGDYPDNSFDYVILSQTLQAVKRPRMVLIEMLRVGRLGIVTFPNFAYWRVRLDLLFNGRMPKTKDLPYEWHNTPNIHLTTINDFLRLCEAEDIAVKKTIYLAGNRQVKTNPNLLASTAVFVVQRNGK